MVPFKKAHRGGGSLFVSWGHLIHLPCFSVDEKLCLRADNSVCKRVSLEKMSKWDVIEDIFICVGPTIKKLLSPDVEKFHSMQMNPTSHFSKLFSTPSAEFVSRSNLMYFNFYVSLFKHFKQIWTWKSNDWLIPDPECFCNLWSHIPDAEQNFYLLPPAAWVVTHHWCAYDVISCSLFCYYCRSLLQFCSTKPISAGWHTVCCFRCDHTKRRSIFKCSVPAVTASISTTWAHVARGYITGCMLIFPLSVLKSKNSNCRKQHC